MTKPVAYGIDIGTSNSAISVAMAGGAETAPMGEAILVPLGPDGDDVMPSVIYLDSTRQRLSGHDAVQQFLVAGGVTGTRLMASVKSFLSDETWHGTEAPWGEFISPSEVAAVIFTALKRQADRYSGADVRRVVIGHPVLFVGAEGHSWKVRQELAIERLEGAARIAGFEEIVFADEPTAALEGEDYEDGIMMSLDFGGGTFDVSIIETVGSKRSLLASQGAAIGGERFDALLFDGALADVLGLTQEYTRGGKSFKVPSSLRRVNTLEGTLRMVGQDETRKAIEHIKACNGGRKISLLDEILFGGHGYALHKQVEQAKIALSSATTAVINLRRPRVNIAATVKRSEFELLIAADIARVDQTVERALRHAHKSPDEIDLVVRTGGSSLIPLFIKTAQDRFGVDKVEQRDALTTVALGLGLIALEKWG